jgi:hypothetical protein
MNRNGEKSMGTQEKVEPKGAKVERPSYQPPHIMKKRAVSRATLFTGGGPDSGGVIGSG